MKLHVFNPGHDLVLANEVEHFRLPQAAIIMEEELSSLPVWWSQKGDSVLVSSLAKVYEWQRGMWGILPQVKWTSLTAKPDDYSFVAPWGWDGNIEKKLFKWGIESNRMPDAASLKKIRELSSRQLAVKALKWIKEADPNGFFCGESCICSTESEIETEMLHRKTVILKAPWSGSGKGLRKGEGGYGVPLSGWCKKILQKQGSVVVEPFYEKKIDFAMEYRCDGMGNVKYEGLSIFRNEGLGAYSGNYLADVSTKLNRIIFYVEKSVIEMVKELHQAFLKEWVAPYYCGPLGIDMMVCRDEGSLDYKIHPCVEINLRYTMGWVALQLERYILPGCEGVFCIDYFSEKGMAYHCHQSCMKEMPGLVENGFLSRGYWPLIPMYEDHHYWVYMNVF